MTETKKKTTVKKEERTQETKNNKRLERIESVVNALLKKAELKVVWDGNKPIIEPDVTPETLKDKERRRLASQVGL